jgi:hypothetical protein
MINPIVPKLKMNPYSRINVLPQGKIILLFLLVFGLLPRIGFSQDTIIQKDQGRIICKIVRQDSTNIFINVLRNGNRVNTFIARNEVVEIRESSTPYMLSLEQGESFPTNTNQEEDDIDQIALGFGLGLDHGFIGANLLVYPEKHLGLFAGGGYAIIGPGYNAGIRLRVFPHKLTPFFTAMYGYNTVIKVENPGFLSKMFYGITLGAGLDLKKGDPSSAGYFSVGILVPIRSQEVDQYIKNLEDNYKIKMKTGLLPIAFTISYKFVLKRS